MLKLFWMIGATVGGAVGWWLGAKVSIMTGYIVSTVFALAGVYGGIKLAQRLMD